MESYFKAHNQILENSLDQMPDGYGLTGNVCTRAWLSACGPKPALNPVPPFPGLLNRCAERYCGKRTEGRVLRESLRDRDFDFDLVCK